MSSFAIHARSTSTIAASIMEGSENLLIFSYEKNLDCSKIISSHSLKTLGIEGGKVVALEFTTIFDELLLLCWQKFSFVFSIININTQTIILNRRTPEPILDCKFSTIFGLSGIPLPIFLFAHSLSFQNFDLTWNHHYHLSDDCANLHCFISEEEFASFNNENIIQITNLTINSMKTLPPFEMGRISKIWTLGNDLLIEGIDNFFIFKNDSYQSFLNKEEGEGVYSILDDGILLLLNGTALIYDNVNGGGDGEWRKLNFLHTFYPFMEIINISIGNDGIIYALFKNNLISEALSSSTRRGSRGKVIPPSKILKRILRSFPIEKDTSLVLYHLNNYLKECSSLIKDDRDSDLIEALIFLNRFCQEKLSSLTNDHLISIFKDTIKDIDCIITGNSFSTTTDNIINENLVKPKLLHHCCNCCSYRSPPSHLAARCYCGF